jgi:hypothetical protein
MNNQSQVLGFRIAAVLCPVIAIGAFQFAMNEPANAKASGDSTQFLPLPTIPDWADVVEQHTDGSVVSPSPFWFEEVEMRLPEMPLVVRPEDTEIEEPDPVFVLTAVLPSNSKSYAVINGKPRAVGDEIAKGWTLNKISGKDRYVIIKHTSGRRVRVLMSQH